MLLDGCTEVTAIFRIDLYFHSSWWVDYMVFLLAPYYSHACLGHFHQQVFSFVF
jgi:hypothetical protein